MRGREGMWEGKRDGEREGGVDRCLNELMEGVKGWKVGGWVHKKSLLYEISGRAASKCYCT